MNSEELKLPNAELPPDIQGLIEGDATEANLDAAMEGQVAILIEAIGEAVFAANQELIVRILTLASFSGGIVATQAFRGQVEAALVGLKKLAETEQAIQSAAKLLPREWLLRFDVGFESGDLTLFDPEGNEVPYPLQEELGSHGEKITSAIHEARRIHHQKLITAAQQVSKEAKEAGHVNLR